MINYAVIDTNVIVSALLSEHKDSATVKILDYILGSGKIIPLLSNEILEEYNNVLRRRKFGFPDARIDRLLSDLERYGRKIQLLEYFDERFIDDTDVKFYAVAMEARDSGSYLVTGNIKHFPKEPFIVTPREMVDIIEGV